MSEGGVQPPAMVVAEAHNIGDLNLDKSKSLQLTRASRYLQCAKEDVGVSEAFVIDLYLKQ